MRLYSLYRNFFDKICINNIERRERKSRECHTKSLWGNTILEKCIENVQYNVSTPNDYIFTSRCNNKNLVKITGYIDTEERTIALYEWALLPATNPDCYKEITIECKFSN